MRAWRRPTARLASLFPGMLALLPFLGLLVMVGFAVAYGLAGSGPGFGTGRLPPGVNIAFALTVVFVVLWLTGMLFSGLLGVIGGAKTRRMVSAVGFGFGVAAMGGLGGALLCVAAIYVAFLARMSSSFGGGYRGAYDQMFGMGRIIHQLVPVIAGMLLIYAGYAAVWMGALREPAERPPLAGPDPAHRLPDQAATASASGGSRSP
jgi:hypothetical protein